MSAEEEKVEKTPKKKSKKWLYIVGGVILLIIIFGKSSSNNSSSNPASGSNSKKATETIYKVGDTITAGNIEYTVQKVEERSVVGGEFFTKSPSAGGTYVAVQYSYKNISEKPIGAFSRPSIKLSDGTTSYSSDIDASGDFATELKLDEKILSDLNPGITVNGASVFEVSKDKYTQGNWNLIVSSGGKDYKVSVK